MKILTLFACLLSACSDNTMSYEELVKFNPQCSKADAQLAQLRNIQRVKNFNPDPDQLNEADRAYNSRLKATIWWYAYRCNKS